MRIVKTEPEFILTKREAEVVMAVLGALSEGMLRNVGLSQEDRHTAHGIFNDIEDILINSRNSRKQETPG